MGCFKVDFSTEYYQEIGIVPSIKEYMKHDVILNIDEYEKGNIHNCIWKKQPEPAIITKEYIEREVTRILRTGVWICIKEELIWIPPNYYFFLQYFTTGGQPPQFRLKRLKHVYFKIGVRNNPKAIGTFTIKNRQDGETTMAMSDCLWEMAEGNMDMGSIGIQSKTRDTVIRSCWRTLKMGWNSIPAWLKQAIYFDFASGDAIETTLKFIRPAKDGDKGRDVLAAYAAGTHNAFDSMNNMRRCVLDEYNKWEECSPYDTFLNYKQFIAAGSSRKGLFDIFSSPMDKETKYLAEVKDFWDKSNPDNLIGGTTENRIFRYYSNPLEGIEGMYDDFGDADADEIYDWIMRERASVKADKKMGEIRANPLNEGEIFESTDTDALWDNTEGIKKRKIYLVNAKYKSLQTLEPVRVYGNLEREDGYMDGDVVFRQADVNQFDVHKARFCFSYLPDESEKIQLKDIYTPPSYIESCLGVDPYGKRYTKGTRKSKGGMVAWKFRDVLGTGINKCPTMIYSNRPHNEHIFYEDVIKAAIFTRSRIQYENITHGLGEYVEDRGYHAWLLPSRGEKEGSKLTGDAPDGKGGFLNEGIALMNALTNVPIDPTEKSLLELHWFDDLLNDMLMLDPKDTHKSDLSMAWMQALIGAIKIMHTKQRTVDKEVVTATLDYLLG